MTDEDIKDEVRRIYGPGLEEEFGQIDESLIDKIASIYNDPDSWSEDSFKKRIDSSIKEK